MQHYKLKRNFEDFYELGELLANKAIQHNSSIIIGDAVYEQLKTDYTYRLINVFLYRLTDLGSKSINVEDVQRLGVNTFHDALNNLIEQTNCEDYAQELNDLTSKYGITLTSNPLKGSKNVNMPSVFISHSSLDKPFAQKIATRLISDGVKVWLDEAEIKVGESLIQKISDSIQDMDFLVVILSKNSINSNWVKKELQIALSLEIQYDRVKVLPIIIEACSIPTTLLGKLYLKFTDSKMFHINYEKLLSTIQNENHPIFLTAREAARVVQAQTQRTGRLVAISQQGINQQYVSFIKRGDWIVADAKTGKSRIWVFEFLDDLYNLLRSFALRDNKIIEYPVLHITSDGVKNEPKLTYQYIDSDLAVNNALEKASDSKVIDPSSSEYFVLTRLMFFDHVKDFIWQITFYDITLGESLTTIYINARNGKVINDSIN